MYNSLSKPPPTMDLALRHSVLSFEAKILTSDGHSFPNFNPKEIFYCHMGFSRDESDALL
jgi:hypothetical protein